MIVNLLATALLLCILGVVFLLIAYLTSLAILLFVPWTQAYLVFAHWLRFQNPSRLVTPEAYALRPFSTRNVRITTSDGLLLGAWHILPTNTPRSVLERIHANELAMPQKDQINSHDLAVNEKTDAIFEAALEDAEYVVLYFHGQVADRGKSNRIATYKGIQEAIPSAHVVTIDCRGYGDSQGFPSEVGFRIDAFAAWQWVTQRVRSDQVVIYGHSLGSGIATNLCLQLEEHQIAPLAMVLDAAFTSMPDMMTAYRKIPIIRPFARFPFLLNHFKLRLLDRFETVRAVETIRSPLLLIHGQEDWDVLISNSHTLFHTALSARRLQSCTREPLATLDASEDQVARAGFDVSFEKSHTTDRDLGPSIHQTISRTPRVQQQNGDAESIHDDSKSRAVNSNGSNSSSALPSRDHKGNGGVHTVQLDFPREGALEYNQEYQIGFLTVQYAAHNTCMEFAISHQVLGSFVGAVQSRQCTNGTQKAVKDLVKVLCHDKIGYVDKSEVPEVVE